MERSFQDITMRLIVERLLPKDHPPICMPSELSTRRRAVQHPRDGRRFHAYCSPSNPGATKMLCEAAERLGIRIAISEQIDELSSCECMLVYLTALTWAGSEENEAFTEEVSRAIAQDVPLLLAHEVPGLGGQEERHCKTSCFEHAAIEDAPSPAAHCLLPMAKAAPARLKVAAALASV